VEGAWESLRSQGARAVVTILTMAAAVATVVALSSVMAGLQTAVEQAFAGFDATVVSVRAVREGESVTPAEARRRRPLALREAALIQARCDSVEAVSVMESRTVEVSGPGGERRRITAVSTTPEYARVHDVAVIHGRFLTAYDAGVGRRVAVVGEDFAREVLGRADAVSHVLRIGGTSYRIVGVVARPKGLFGEVMQSKLFVPVGALEPRDVDAAVFDADVLGRPGVEPERVAEDVRRRLRHVRRLRPAEADTFAVYGSDMFLGFYERTTKGVFALLVFTSSIGLLVGGIGLMNVMFMGVRQRTREIGIRRAVGARRRDVLAQFLFEAVAVSLVGGTAGLAGGVVFAGAVRVFSPLPAAVQPAWAAAAIIAATAVGLVFGIWPARRAAQVDPIAALRAE
jgi:putative ABC transport system permease protein